MEKKMMNMEEKEEELELAERIEACEDVSSIEGEEMAHRDRTYQYKKVKKLAEKWDRKWLTKVEANEIRGWDCRPNR